MGSERAQTTSHLIAHSLIPFWLSGPRILVLPFAICHLNHFSWFLGTLASTRFSTFQPSLLSTQRGHMSHPSVHLSGCYVLAQKLSVAPYHTPHQLRLLSLASLLPLSCPILSCSFPSFYCSPFIVARLICFPFL